MKGQGKGGLNECGEPEDNAGTPDTNNIGTACFLGGGMGTLGSLEKDCSRHKLVLGNLLVLTDEQLQGQDWKRLKLLWTLEQLIG